MTTIQQAPDLGELNRLIAKKETAGDAEFFESLLAPRFAMRRARTSTYVGRGEFVGGVELSFERHTEDVRVLLETETIAVLRCTIVREPDGGRFDNLRVFVRPSVAAEWKLLAWANESLTEGPDH